jgi:hypothetical protein
VTPAYIHPVAPTRSDLEAVDRELLELPNPPRRERSFTVAFLLLAAVASLLMAFALRREVAFVFEASTPTELQDIGAAPATLFRENTYVSGHAMLGVAHAIRYERAFVGQSFRLMPVAGRPDVWVEVRIPEGQETSRFVPPSRFAGRLIHFDSAGPRHRGLASAVRDATGERVPPGTWLLIDGDAPSDARWALILVAVLIAFAVWNIVVMTKLVRRVRL